MIITKELMKIIKGNKLNRVPLNLIIVGYYLNKLKKASNGFNKFHK
jgi:hypothetical protein